MSFQQFILSQAGVEGQARQIRQLSGGCISEVSLLEIEAGLGSVKQAVLKHGPRSQSRLFEAECLGLRVLSATNSAKIPRVYVQATDSDHSGLLLEYLQPANSAGRSIEAYQDFAQQLHKLHQCGPQELIEDLDLEGPQVSSAQAYGFFKDNFIGATSQPNSWKSSWVEFMQEERLNHQIRLAVDKSLLGGKVLSSLEDLVSNLGDYLPDQPHSGLLHGDLWSGNALATSGTLPSSSSNAEKSLQTSIALIDPACSFGDAWADIAMMKLFGGFPAEFYSAYEALNQDQKDLSNRIHIYQLYHLLNHLNLFGASYLSQVKNTLSAIR